MKPVLSDIIQYAPGQTFCARITGCWRMKADNTVKRVTQVSDLTGYTVYTVTSLVENTKICKVRMEDHNMLTPMRKKTPKK